jgi:dihydropteroate synthase
MGVVNITPDSFSDGGTHLSPADAIAHAVQMLEEGADLIDLGAESTRPGTRVGTDSNGDNPPDVSAEEEQARLLPVLQGILEARPDAVISVDTYKAATAHAALVAGAEIINDVSGFCWDSQMAGVCAQARCGVVLMHTRGLPSQWRTQEQLEADDLIAMVSAGLRASLNLAISAGIGAEAIVLDPGYGFGKRGDENFALLAQQEELLALDRPLLAGVSRKSFLGRELASLYNGKAAPVENREIASISAMVAAILKGASLVRVHRVGEAVEAAIIADAVLSGLTR